MVIVDTTVRVEDSYGLLEALQKAQVRPIYVVVGRELLEEVEVHLRKAMLLYRKVGEDEREVRLLVLAPETLFRIDRDIAQKSDWLADPDVIATVFKLFPVVSIEELESPNDVLRFTVGSCKNKYNFLTFISTGGWGYAYVTCVNEVILAAVFADQELSYGIKAIRKIFYFGPYLALRYVIDPRKLEE